jgi:hypothetical protein
MNKNELIEALRAERARWEALLAEVGAERMTVPGATGKWSVKDVIAHLTAWEERPVAWLEAAQTGGQPTPPPWDSALSSYEQVNEWLFQSNRERSLSDVLTQSRQVFDRLIELIRAVPYEDITTPGRFEWLEGGTILERIPGDSYAHYQEHATWIRSWLRESSGVNPS